MVRFASETRMPRFLEVLRYKHDTKILWINEALEWNKRNGDALPTVGVVTWFDEGTPWAVFGIEEVVYNVNVREYIRAKGL